MQPEGLAFLELLDSLGRQNTGDGRPSKSSGSRRHPGTGCWYQTAESREPPLVNLVPLDDQELKDVGEVGISFQYDICGIRIQVCCTVRDVIVRRVIQGLLTAILYLAYTHLVII